MGFRFPFPLLDGKKRKHDSSPCADISAAQFDYEKTVHDVIIPRVLSVIKYRENYLESWCFPSASHNRLVLLHGLLTRTLSDIIVDDDFDVTVHGNCVYISVSKASKYTALKVELYKRERLGAY